jgi:flagellar basal body-associated protein FliL
MAKPTNDELVKRHKQLRDTLIATCSKSAAEKIVKLKKPSVEEIATVIANEFKASAIRFIIATMDSCSVEPQAV